MVTGSLTRLTCATCKRRRLWLLTVEDILMAVCPPCDLKADQ